MTVAARAHAHPGTTGYSGKPYNGVSETCTTNCHAKGVAPPTLTITVPASVQAGSTNAVKIVVAGNKSRTSLNAAFSDGVKTTKGANTDTPLPKEEPTEIAAVVPPPSGGSATYDFTFTAPLVSGTITMWVAGMAASGNGTNGDGVANAVRTITVTGAGSDAGSDAGGPADSGVVADASASDAAAPPGAPRDPGGGTSGAPSNGETPDAGDGGCAVVTGASDGPGSVVALGLVIAAALRLRRRGGKGSAR